ncbi:MAG: acyl carrier protein [Desulfobulbus sp.]|uniref:acyl carrier protein n=1 Tax=uncultured Desulfobulbus sp. TaxID=239745 RepID=UPI001B4B966D|nr:acyl carrier protein [uncultured Desulfobulbus sp.]MBP7516671.1 acyl carrier protein [Desulfobulbus sp.]
MATHAQILAQIQEMLAEILPQGAPQVTADLDLINDLNINSLKVMELVEKLEDAYDLSIPINILAGVRTVGDLVKAIGTLTES